MSDNNAELQNNKIFGIGFHKTGTTSLSAALQILGYNAIHGDPRKAPHFGSEGKMLIKKYINRGNFNLPTFNHYDAFTDNPYFSIWFEILKIYPDGKYILTVRDEQDWINSCEVFYSGRRIRPMRHWMFGQHADPSLNEASKEAWLKRYIKHNQDVVIHFKAINKELLVMDITKGDGWDMLCPFLEKPIPPLPFPHRNNKGSLKRADRKLLAKLAYLKKRVF